MMHKIQLLYVENIISRKKSTIQQTLSFFMSVENVTYDKKIDVVWAGEDGVWQTLPAHFHSAVNQDKEYWSATVIFNPTAEQSLPGNIQFGLRFQYHGEEYWDNNNGDNFSSQADSGIQILSNKPVQNIAFGGQLSTRQRSVPITVAVDSALQAEKVTINWTTDDWLSSQQTVCEFKRNYWDKKAKSNARNPNHYGVEIWKARVKIGSAFRLQYSICCESQGQLFWDNNDGFNYTVSHDQLTVLILNLHCYQEDEQDYKFSQIAKAIDELNVDIVCLQEVAENWNNGEGDWDSNSAKIINDRLEKPFHIYTDWSHLGFDKYREGVAILSRFAMANQESSYVSESNDIYSIHSRKVVMAQIAIPFVGKVNVFSAHLSWWEDGFEGQFKRLSEWATHRHADNTIGTLLCGDFNIAAGSQGYSQVVASNDYEDQYLAANAKGLFDQIFKVNDAHWQDLLTDDYRIDYIFKNKNCGLHVTSAKVLFTESDYGRVSDHCGYIMTFEP